MEMRTMYLAGLEVDVFDSAGEGESSEDYTLVVCSHGRTRDRSQVHRNARDFARSPVSRVISICVDARNHGSRQVLPKANSGLVARDLYELVSGTASDLAHLVLSAPLRFPGATCVRRVLFGISLGGHASILAARNTPQVDVCLSLLGAADFDALARVRFPSMWQGSPVPPGHNPRCHFWLSSGSRDTMVPREATREFAEASDNVVWKIYPVEHIISQAMWESCFAYFVCTLSRASMLQK